MQRKREPEIRLSKGWLHVFVSEDAEKLLLGVTYTVGFSFICWLVYDINKILHPIDVSRFVVFVLFISLILISLVVRKGMKYSFSLKEGLQVENNYKGESGDSNDDNVAQ